MKNRAKCKLCNEILESLHAFDYVSCKCGEISISGGSDKLECSAKDWKNFLRIDENGHEIVVKVKGQEESPAPTAEVPSMSRADMLEMLESMIKNIQDLPQTAMYQPVTHYDLYTYIIVVLAILKKEKTD